MNRLMLAAVFLAASSGSGYAETFKILGPRPMGMGGAFVAMAEGSLAQYWNPAGLGQDATNSKVGLQIPIGAKAEFTGGVLNDANTISNMSSQFSSIQNAQKNGKSLDAKTMGAFVQALPTIADLNQPGKGVLGDVEGGANFKMGRFAASVNNFTSVGASPFVDETNIGLGASSGQSGVNFTGANTGAPADPTQAAAANQIAGAFTNTTVANLNSLTGGALSNAGITTPAQLGNALVNFSASNGQSNADIQAAAAQIAANAGAAAPIIAAAASGNSYSNNNTNLTVRGASLTEIAFGYGRPLIVPGLYVGANIKVILAKVGYARYDVLQNNSGSTDILKQFKNNTASSAAPALDLGVLYKLDELLPAVPFHPRAGLVAKNINNPKFSQPSLATANGEGSKYPDNGQLRMGLAVTPLSFWNIAFDMDLTQNNTPVPGYHSRMVGLGTEVNVFNRTWINIPLRAGLMENMADASSKLAYTAGFGLNFLHFMVDVGGAVSSDQTQIKDGQKMPSNLSVAAQLGFMF